MSETDNIKSVLQGLIEILDSKGFFGEKRAEVLLDNLLSKPTNEIKEREETLKLKPGMLLVYTPSAILSSAAKDDWFKELEEKACKSMCRVPRNLPIGILIMNPGDKLEVLPKKTLENGINNRIKKIIDEVCEFEGKEECLLTKYGKRGDALIIIRGIINEANPDT